MKDYELTCTDNRVYSTKADLDTLGVTQMLGVCTWILCEDYNSRPVYVRTDSVVSVREKDYWER